MRELMTTQTNLKRTRPPVLSVLTIASILLLVVVSLDVGEGFNVPTTQKANRLTVLPLRGPLQYKSWNSESAASSSSTALKIWWMGGSESTEAVDQNADSCEIVPVRIERPTSGSRKIFGEIHAATSLLEVWGILTDYDRLVTHVPNLKESRIVGTLSRGQPGDGQFRCRLFQRGAQKIIGFEFGASVTMEMTEKIVSETERRISFKCVDSFFFSEFDGEWKVESQVDENGKEETKISYNVLVKPKGPVPVAALEWRIREDVPTNLRAVKLAAQTVGAAKIKRQLAQAREALEQEIGATMEKATTARSRLVESMRRRVSWQKDETMAAYLTTD